MTICKSYCSIEVLKSFHLGFTHVEQVKIGHTAQRMDKTQNWYPENILNLVSKRKMIFVFSLKESFIVLCQVCNSGTYLLKLKMCSNHISRVCSKRIGECRQCSKKLLPRTQFIRNCRMGVLFLSKPVPRHKKPISLKGGQLLIVSLQPSDKIRSFDVSITKLNNLICIF